MWVWGNLRRRIFLVLSNTVGSLSCGIYVFIKSFLYVYWFCIKKYDPYFVSGKEKNRLLFQRNGSLPWQLIMKREVEQKTVKGRIESVMRSSANNWNPPYFVFKKKISLFCLKFLLIFFFLFTAREVILHF